MPNNHNAADTAKMPNVTVVGDPDAWVLVCKAHSNENGQGYGWMKSTKRMAVPGGGFIYQVTTEHRFDGRVTACAESITFVP